MVSSLGKTVGPEKIRNSRSLEGDRDRGRRGEGGGFLRSMRSTDEDEGNNGTDCARPWFGGTTVESTPDGPISLGPGVVAERLRVGFFLASG